MDYDDNNLGQRNMNESEIKSEELRNEITNQIKLIKNRNGYNWEIKILSLDVDLIEKLNNEMKKKFSEQRDIYPKQ